MAEQDLGTVGPRVPITRMWGGRPRPRPTPTSALVRCERSVSDETSGVWGPRAGVGARPTGVSCG